MKRLIFLGGLFLFVSLQLFTALLVLFGFLLEVKKGILIVKTTRIALKLHVSTIYGFLILKIVLLNHAIALRGMFLRHSSQIQALHTEQNFTGRSFLSSNAH